MRVMSAAIVLMGWAGAAVAAEPPDTVRLGTLATLAPLCGLRNEAWSFDLRRAAIQSATRAARPDDPALKAAPGSDQAAAALSYAEAEALEDFAESAPAVTCVPLARGPELDQADHLVEEFRRRVAALSGS